MGLPLTHPCPVPAPPPAVTTCSSTCAHVLSGTDPLVVRYGPLAGHCSPTTPLPFCRYRLTTSVPLGSNSRTKRTLPTLPPSTVVSKSPLTSRSVGAVARVLLA